MTGRDEARGGPRGVRPSLYLGDMEFKEQIVTAIAEELRLFLPASYNIATQCSHGCWKTIICDGNHFPAVEVLLYFTSVGDSDKVYITYNAVLTVIEVLSDPTWIDRFLNEVRRDHQKVMGT